LRCKKKTSCRVDEKRGKEKERVRNESSPISSSRGRLERRESEEKKWNIGEEGKAFSERCSAQRILEKGVVAEGKIGKGSTKGPFSSKKKEIPEERG